MSSQTASATASAPERLRSAQRQIGEDLRKAEAELTRIVADHPDFLPARRLLAKVLRDMNRDQEAAIFEAETIARGVARNTFQSAEEAFLANDLERAEPLIRTHLRHDPEDPAGAMMLGEIASRCGARQEAENLFRRAILLAPSYIAVRMALAKHQRDGGQYDAALNTLEALLDLKADHLPALSLKASILEQMRRFEEADAAFERLHALHPDDPRGWSNHAFLLKTIGKQDEAISAYRRALTIDSGYPLAWWGLSNLKTVKFDASDVKAMEAGIARKNLDPDEKVNLLYALGKARDDLKDYSGAFEAYQQGARIRLSRVPYDPQKVQDHVSKSQNTCTAPFISARKGWASKAKDPIFIVSLPRSGSTLVEQILASHPMIEGTEELHDIERIALSLAPEHGTGGWLDILPRLSSEDVAKLGDHYIEATRRFRHTDRPLFTDKMPSNWVFLGLILTILPNAKIIDIRRHPLGCGFANFSQHFNWGINFSYKLEHIGSFYRAYLRQMSHFDKVAPGKIHHITYENLVQNTEIEIRRLLHYIGVPFSESCLRFFENKRAVYTPSSEQVRSPINRDGMTRWHQYEPFLGPLKQALGSALDSYPDIPADIG